MASAVSKHHLRRRFLPDSSPGIHAALEKFGVLIAEGSKLWRY